MPKAANRGAPTGPWTLADLRSGKIGLKKNNLNVFTTFHCGGGSSMGYKLAGFDVVGGVEIDPKMMALYRKNHSPRADASFDMPIQSFDPRDLPSDLHGKIDILDGSPPCSSFSMAGARERLWGVEKKFKEGQAKQVLDDLFFHFIRVAKDMRPKVVIAENVKGLISGSARGYVKNIFQEFHRAGYNTQLFLINSAYTGVPQVRERVVFVSIRQDLDFPMIKMDFHEQPIPFSEVMEPQDAVRPPVGESLKGAGKWLLNRRLDEVVKWNLAVKGKGTMFTQKMALPNRPVKTLTASGRHIYPGSDSFLSDREVIRCQTFPDDYDFMDQKVHYVCGMSVPPFMMMRVASEVARQLFGVEQRPTTVRRLPAPK